MSRIDEIRTRLDTATEGPWDLVPTQSLHMERNAVVSFLAGGEFR